MIRIWEKRGLIYQFFKRNWKENPIKINLSQFYLYVLGTLKGFAGNLKNKNKALKVYNWIYSIFSVVNINNFRLLYKY